MEATIWAAVRHAAPNATPAPSEPSPRASGSFGGAGGPFICAARGQANRARPHRWPRTSSGVHGSPGRFLRPCTRSRARRPARGSSRTHARPRRSEEHTSELQSPYDLVCRLLLEKKKKNTALLYPLDDNIRIPSISAEL